MLRDCHATHTERRPAHAGMDGAAKPAGHWRRPRSRPAWADGAQRRAAAADGQRLRNAQAQGLFPASAAPARMAALGAQPTVEGVVVTAPRKQIAPAARPTPSKGPLAGRPGTAAMVAGALNKIASGPNTSAQIESSLENGIVTRGPGRGVQARGKVAGVDLPIGVRGTLDPLRSRRDFSVGHRRPLDWPSEAHPRLHHADWGARF